MEDVLEKWITTVHGLYCTVCKSVILFFLHPWHIEKIISSMHHVGPKKKSTDLKIILKKSLCKLGPVQTLLHSCAEPNWWIIIKYGKRVASELIWYGSFSLVQQSVKFDSDCQSVVELNLGSTQSGSSESDFAPVLLQSPTYPVRFGSWKVRRLNQVLHTRCLELEVHWPVQCSGLIFSIGKYDDNNPSFHAGCVVMCYTIDL